MAVATVNELIGLLVFKQRWRVTYKSGYRLCYGKGHATQLLNLSLSKSVRSGHMHKGRLGELGDSYFQVHNAPRS